MSKTSDDAYAELARRLSCSRAAAKLLLYRCMWGIESDPVVSDLVVKHATDILSEVKGARL